MPHSQSFTYDYSIASEVSYLRNLPFLKWHIVKWRRLIRSHTNQSRLAGAYTWHTKPKADIHYTFSLPRNWSCPRHIVPPLPACKPAVWPRRSGDRETCYFTQNISFAFIQLLTLKSYNKWNTLKHVSNYRLSSVPFVAFIDVGSHVD